MSVILATSASVGSVLAAGNATAGGAAGNMTKAGNATAGGAAGNMTKAASNSSSSSNPLAKLGQALSGIFGGKK